jgi:cobalt-zinc-cadmium resistance protein CzcA
MIGALVALSVRHRGLVLFFTFLAAALALFAAKGLPVDAVPDISNVQVQVLTAAPGLSPLETEAQVTRPVELSMTGLPHLKELRSVSRSGISAVTLVFEDDLPLADARTLVSQRMPSAREATKGSGEPQMGPMATGLGEVFHFTVRWPGHTPSEVRTLLDWEIARPLRLLPGVVEVNGWGGDVEEVEVLVRPEDLRRFSVTQGDVEEALTGGGHNRGGGAVPRGGEQLLVRLDAQYKSLADVEAVPLASKIPGTNTPLAVRDVATVRSGARYRLAAATEDGKGETVYAMVQMVAGGNAREVAAAVKTRLDEIAPRLPKGAVVVPFYDRKAFVDRVLGTVEHSLLEGAIVVVVVLFLLLGDLRAGLVVATAIPLSLLGALAWMRVTGQSGNLMSLGAVDFGLVVDGAVVVVEGALAAMVRDRISASEALVREGKSVGAPIAFGVVVIGVVYVPILALDGVEGKLFRPMAITVLFALATALVLSFTFIPALASLVLKPAKDDHESWILRKVRPLFSRASAFFWRLPNVAIAAAIGFVVVSGVAASRLGTEFVPRLEEGDIVVQLTRPPSVSLAEAIAGTGAVETALLSFPEVDRVVSRTGAPDVATDVMGLEQSDVFVMLKPRSQWRFHDREALVGAMETALKSALPGTGFAFSQPIQMRNDELLGGMKSDVGIKVYGDDLAATSAAAAKVAQVAGGVTGACDVRVEATSGLALATLRPDPAALSVRGVPPSDLAATFEAFGPGRPLGQVAFGDRRVDLTLKRARPLDAEGLRDEPIIVPGGRAVPLGAVARYEAQDGPAQIGREAGRRRVLVELNVRGRDLGGFVKALEAEVGKIPLPSGSFVEFTGANEHLEHAAQRFALVLPLTLAAVLVLLYLAFQQFRPALFLMLIVPAATSGGLLALLARGLPLSISAVVGLVALAGVAVMNGTVLLTAIRREEEGGASATDAAKAAASERLRPVLTTAFVAGVGFLPMALATGTGAEVQRPLATVVVGGLITATFLTLFVLPVLWARSATGPKSPVDAGVVGDSGARAS